MALTFDDQQAATLLEALGLTDPNTDAATALATVQDAVTAPTANGASPAAVTAAAKRAGLEVVDSATLQSLRHDAAEGRKFAADAARDKINAQVVDAIQKGKIPGSRKDHWTSLISNDAEMGKVLDAIAPETAVPLTEIGHSMANEDGQNPGASAEAWFY